MIFKNLFVLSASFLLHLHLSLSQQERRIDPELKQKIDDFVNNVYLPQAQAQGLGLAIMQNDGELLYTTGYGLANIEEGIPNGNDTQFGVGSISKGFSALVVTKTLHEHFPEMGEAVLDTPIKQLAPQMNITFIDRFRSEHITIRDLLAHRHCLGVDWFSIAAESVSSRDEGMYRQRYLKEICGFRSSMAYNNAMVTMAGEVAAAIANKSFEDLAQDVFDALGMNNSAFIKSSDDFSKMPGRSRPYYIYEGERYTVNTDLSKRITHFGPAGGLFSTPNDMVRYLSLILRRGELDGKRILPKEVIDWMVKPSNQMGLANYKGKEGDKPFSEFAYGLGLMVSSYDGWQMIEHGGSNFPYSGQIAVFPAKNLVVFNAIHEGPERLPRTVLPLFIFDVLNGDQNAEQTALRRMNDVNMQGTRMDNTFERRPDSEEILAKIKTYSKSNNRGHGRLAIPTGLYGNGAIGDLYITERNNSESNTTELFMELGKWYRGWLRDDPRFPGILYSVKLTTDVWQDFYGLGVPQLGIYVLVFPDAEIPTIATLVADPFLVFVVMYEEFVYGNGLDTLPVIPWDPNSCGL